MELEVRARRAEPLDRIEQASVEELMAWILRTPGATSLQAVFSS